MEANSRPRMQSIILLVLLPSLLLVTVVIGGVIYNNLQKIIMADGFDRKLVAIATIFGSFVNGDDHKKIILDRKITGLSPNPSKDLFYGIDAATNELVTVNQRADDKAVNYYSTGGATEIGPLSFKPSRNLAYVPAWKILLTLDDEGRLIKIDPKSGGSKVIGRANPSLRGLVFDPKTNALYGSDHRLARIDPRTGATSFIGETGFKDVTALAAKPETGELYGYDNATRGILLIDPRSGKGRSLGVLSPAKGDESQTRHPLKLTALAFGSDGLYGATRDAVADFHDLYGITQTDSTIQSIIPADRLTKIDPKTATASLSPYDIGYKNEAAPLYHKYFQKMRNLKKPLDITFFYSLVPWQGKWVQYVIDETPPDPNDPEGGHTYPGTPDLFLEAQAQGIKDVATHHTVYLSDIQAWQKWGILKSAYAPIYSYADIDDVEGIAGTDLNVSIIRVKTSEALGRVGLAALVSLIIGAFISYFIARRLTQPISEVKDVAIQVASGQYGHKIEVSEPKEMADLATTFNLMSETLEENVRETTAANRSLEQRRRKQELFRVLNDLTEDYPSSEPERLAFAWMGENSDRPGVSGFALSRDGSLLLAWIGDSSEEPLQVAKTRSDIRAIAKRLLEKYREDWDALSRQLEYLYADTVRAYVLMDSRNGRIHSLARQFAPALLLSPDGAARSLDLREVSEFKIPPGQSFLIDSSSREASPSRRVVALTRESGAVSSSADRLLGEAMRSSRSDAQGATLTQEENGFIAIMSSPA